YWLLAIGYWLLAIGYWLLAIGYWLLAIADCAGHGSRLCLRSQHVWLALSVAIAANRVIA
ncbi:hypothetical protein ACK3YF_00525, partial [Aeromonas allosaccharophila]|uniref:hypothetical protein n=1 Tax=Aeromonas allosaccharophila TaxID=656 RepID=UPI003987A341